MRLLLSLLLLLGGVSSKACTTKAKTTTIQPTPNLLVLAQDASSTTTGESTSVANDQTSPPTTSGSSPGSESPATASSTSFSSTSVVSSSSTTTEEFEDCTTDGSSTPVATTTLPQVNVSVVQFSMGTCSNGICSYTYIAPINNPNFLNTEKSYIDADQIVYKNASDHVNEFKSNVSGTTNDATSKVNDLRTKLEIAQNQLTLMQQQLDLITNYTNMAASNVAAASYFVNQIRVTQSCYWQCKQPPTTPTPSTTSTTTPTPTPGPCQSGAFNCPLTSGSASTTPATTQDVCKYDKKGTPYCTNCDGNMDGYQQCEASRCDPDGYNVTLGVNWSPGYNSTTTNVTLPTGATCVWNYPTAYNFSTLRSTFDFSTIGLPGDTPQLYISPDNVDSIGTYALNYLTTNTAKINNWLAKNSVKYYKIVLTTPEIVSPSSYFFFSTCIGLSCNPQTA